jgi:monoamine oxidase
MHSWDLLGAQAGARPSLSGTPKNARVIILGAGISGMTAGYELSKLGYDVRILEARDRVGGVNWTVRKGATHTELGPNGETQLCSFDEGMYVNGGPWRLPHWHTGVLGYCKELGVPLEVFVNEGEASYFYYEGSSIGPLANKRVRLREVKADMIGYTCELMAKVVNQNALDMPLSAEDKERFVTFLVTEGYLDSADRAYKKTTARGPGDPHDFRALLQSGFPNRIRSVIEGTGQAPMFQPVGGMDQFPKGFQRKLGDAITFGAEIVSIRQSDTDVKVVYRDVKTGARTEIEQLLSLPSGYHRDLQYTKAPLLRACAHGLDALALVPDLLERMQWREAAMRAERTAIQQALDRFRWNRRKAADYLGVSYKTLLNKMKECGISEQQ